MKQSALVFVVDDDLATRSSLEALLTSHGYTVKSYETAAKLLIELETAGDVGCIVIDLSPAEGGGRKLLKWLEESGSLLSVVVMTGLFESAEEMEATHLLSPPLEKPYEASALLKMVADGIAGSLSRKAVRDRQHRT